MIISPLEQFNICPLWAFAVIDITNLGIFFSKTLFNIWLILSEIACTATRVFGFDPITDHDKTTFFMAYGVVGVARYTTLFLSSTFVFIWTALSGELVANVYRDTFSYFESLHSEHYDLVALTKTLSSIEPRNVVGTSYLEYDSAFAMILSGAYCAITELALTMFSLVRGFGLDLLLNLSNQDFTYLILSVNTSTIWLLFIAAFIIFLMRAALTHTFLISKNSFQSGLELLYEVVLGIVSENAGSKLIKYFPLIYTTFIIILCSNLLGMIPYSFTITSHLIVTFSAALATFIGLNIIGIVKNRIHFLSLFFPPGAPIGLAPLLVFIEFVSYIFRVLSLSIRLFANLMSGHTLLKILSGFAWVAISFYGIYLIPIFIIFLVTGLEFGIAMIQAYIFSVLLCIYLNDAVNLH